MSTLTFADEIARKAPASVGFQPAAAKRAPTLRAAFLSFALALYIIVSAVQSASAAGYIWFFNGVANGAYANEDSLVLTANILDLVAQYSAVAFVGVFALCVVAYLMFIYGAVRNIERAKARGMNTTAVGAVLWSFVPFANLAKIYQAVSDAWSASHDPTRGSANPPGWLPVWWGCYLGSNLLSTVALALQQPLLDADELDIGALNIAFGVDALSSIASIVAGVLLYICVGSIARAQKAWTAPNA